MDAKKYREHTSQQNAADLDIDSIIENLHIHQAELETQNEELKRAQSDLEESRRDYTDLYDLSPVGYLTLVKHGLVKQMNLTAASLLGVDRNFFVGKPFNVLVTKEFKKTFWDYHAKVLASSKKENCDIQLKKKNGTLFYAHLECIRADSVPDGMYCTLTDVTENRLMQEELARRNEELERSSEKYKYLVEHAPTGIYEVSFLTHKFISVNDAMCTTLGYTREELLSMSAFDILDEDGKRLFAERIKKQSAGEKVDESVEYRVLTKDERLIWASLNVSFIYDHGTVVGAQVVAHDVTKQRKALEALKSSEEQFRKAIEAAPIPIIMQSEDGQVLQLSHAWTELTGYSIEDTRTFDEWTTKAVYGEGANEVRDHLRELLSGNARSIHVDFIVRTATGENRCWDFSASSPGILADGRRFIVGMAIDITERKQAEEDLAQSNKKIRDILNSIQDTIYALDRNWVVVYASKSFTSRFGKEPSDFIGKSIWQILPRLAGTIYETNVREAMDKREARRFELKGVRTDSYYNIAVFPSEEGVTVLGVDITERKRVENALRESEERFKTLSETSPVGVGVSSEDGILLYANPAYERILGYDPGEMVGMNSADLYWEPENREFWLEELKDHGIVRDLEVILRKKDDEPIWISINTTHIIFGGKPAFMGTIQDISERKYMEEALHKSKDELETRVDERTSELSQAYEDLQDEMRKRQGAEERLRQSQKMEAIGTLAGGIAHDFNNILAGIIGFAEMVEEDLPTESASRKHIQRVLKASERGKDLVRQILTFSRKTSLKRSPISLKAIIKETRHLLRASIPSTIDIQVDLKAKNDIVRAAPAELQQVLMNLVTNATAAMMDTGGVLGITTVDSDVEEGLANKLNIQPGRYIELIVTDTGTGIPPNIKDRIFEPFFTTKEAGKGTGMGLPVVYGTLRALGGAVTVESAIGIGSTFKVFLPTMNESGDLKSKEEDIRGGSENILFVDDEELLVAVAEDMLKRLGYAVTGLTDPRQALKLLLADPFAFDLIIVDQTMPKLTGFDLAKKVLEVRPNAPIILCTGHSDTVTEQSATDAGIRAFLMKPLTKKELAKAIRKVLERK